MLKLYTGGVSCRHHAAAEGVMRSSSNQYDRLDSLKHQTLRFSQKVLVLLTDNDSTLKALHHNNVIKRLSLTTEIEPT